MPKFTDKNDTPLTLSQAQEAIGAYLARVLRVSSGRLSVELVDLPRDGVLYSVLLDGQGLSQEQHGLVLRVLQRSVSGTIQPVSVVGQA